MLEAPEDEDRGWKRRESLPSALLQIAIVGVVLAAAVFALYLRGQRRQQAAQHIEAARSLALRDNATDLEKAVRELEAVFQVNPKMMDAAALEADIETQLWLVHRVPGAETKARARLATAVQEDSHSEERYGTEALHLVADGKAAEAVAFIEDLRRKGASSPRLWLALGQAYGALGLRPLARQALAKAMEGAPRAPRFAYAYAEELLEDGLLPEAADAFGRALGSQAEHLPSRIGQLLARVHRREKLVDVWTSLQAALERKADLTPGLESRALAVRAELQNAQEKPDDALREVEGALAKNPDEPFALFTRGRALAMKKDASAVEAFKGAIAKRPAAPFFYLEGAAILSAAQDAAGAVQLLDAYETFFRGVKPPLDAGVAGTLLERDDRYWLARGDILAAAGRVDEALAAYDRAIAARGLLLPRALSAKAALTSSRR